MAINRGAMDVEPIRRGDRLRERERGDAINRDRLDDLLKSVALLLRD
jgi:hypothetical protein